jgi:hypothetical protein
VHYNNLHNNKPVIKSASLSILSAVAALLALPIVGAATTTFPQFTSIDVVKSAYAFPCKGGNGEQYCRGIMLVLFKQTKMIMPAM